MQKTKMIDSNKQTKVFAISVIALLAVSTLVITSVTARTPALSIPNYVYIIASPNPIGVDQTISLFAWTAAYPPTGNGQYGDRWTNLQIIVTKPDGTNTTLGSFTSDSVGAIFTNYTPETIGNYSFQFHMPAYTIVGYNSEFPVTPPSSQTNTIYIGDTFQEAWSTPVVVEVTNEPVASAPSYPLPTDYWTTPVSQSGHDEWVYITGDWLAAPVPDRRTNDNTETPTTAHIAWTKAINFGGVGGQSSAIASGGDNYYSYLAYEPMFNNVIIMNGRLYYNTPNPPQYGFTAVDLRSGEQLWYNNGTQDPLAVKQYTAPSVKNNYPQLSFGQELDYESPNQHGLISYLWVTYTLSNGSNVWAMYDPFSGNWICDIVGVPAASGPFYVSYMTTDEIGSYIILSPSSDFKTMTIWNSTKCIQNTNPSLTSANGYWSWRPPLGGIFSASSGTTLYNTTGIPAAFQQSTLRLSLLGIDTQKQIAIYCNSTTVQGTLSYPTPNVIASIGISIAPATLGECKWSQIQPYPSGNVTLINGFVGDGAYTLYSKETTTWIGYNSTTGEKIWVSAKPEVSLHSYGVTGGIYNNVLYSGDSIGEGGVIYAYDITNGNLLWQSTPVPMGNTGYWDYVPHTVGTFANGVIYWYGSEHSPGPNLEPGFKMGALNATTGQEIWNITFWNSVGVLPPALPLPIANGYIIALNAYDNQIYAFGKGPTSTTVQTPLAGVMEGQSFTIQGMVMDISAGASQNSIRARFPNGLPAVSDDSMTPWMEYVYMQQQLSTTAIGVPVTLTAIDPNGNTVIFGTATTDNSGTFGFQVNPSMLSAGSGTYRIIASFFGSESYWSSHATSYVTVNSAPTISPTAVPQTVLTTSDLMTYIVAGVIAIILAIAIVAVLILRRRL
jgi:hypothetical protein